MYNQQKMLAIVNAFDPFLVTATFGTGQTPTHFLIWPYVRKILPPQIGKSTKHNRKQGNAAATTRNTFDIAHSATSWGSILADTDLKIDWIY